MATALEQPLVTKCRLTRWKNIGGKSLYFAPAVLLLNVENLRCADFPDRESAQWKAWIERCRTSLFNEYSSQLSLFFHVVANQLKQNPISISMLVDRVILKTTVLLKTTVNAVVV